MPVMTFAEFAVEQALGIAIGAVAILAAPKAGPKVAALAGSLSDGLRSTLVSAPAAASRQAMYGRVASGVHSFGEHWSKLIDEAMTPSHPVETPVIASVAELLPFVSRQSVVSQAPGRVRLSLRPLLRQPLLAEQITEALTAMGGIWRVQANPRTGSVLVLYDSDRYPTLDSLLAGISQW